MRWGDMDRIDKAHECGNEPSVFIKCREFLGEQKNFSLSGRSLLHGIK